MSKIFIIIVLILLFNGCDRNNKYMQKTEEIHSEILLDSINNTIQLSSLDLKYHIYRPENAVIAKTNNLPEHIYFCVVDTLFYISTLLLQLDKKPESDIDAKEIVNNIALQKNEIYESDMNYNLERCNYVNRNAWKFNVDLKMSNTEDTISVIYSGYIFDDLAIVSTCNAKTLKLADLLPYLGGLKQSN